jgi:hypothetical protein
MIFITTYDKLPSIISHLRNREDVLRRLLKVVGVVPRQQFERFEREACLRYLRLLEQTTLTDQVVEAAISPASVDVSATYVAQQSVLASSSSKYEQSSKMKKNFPHNKSPLETPNPFSIS